VLPPGMVWPPLPPSVTGTVMALVWVVGCGYRWTVIDTSLKPTPQKLSPPSTVRTSPSGDDEDDDDDDDDGHGNPHKP
jgi:hypothetical protein